MWAYFINCITLTLGKTLMKQIASSVITTLRTSDFRVTWSWLGTVTFLLTFETKVSCETLLERIQLSYQLILIINTYKCSPNVVVKLCVKRSSIYHGICFHGYWRLLSSINNKEGTPPKGFPKYLLWENVEKIGYYFGDEKLLLSSQSPLPYVLYK